MTVFIYIYIFKFKILKRTLENHKLEDNSEFLYSVAESKKIVKMYYLAERFRVFRIKLSVRNILVAIFN